jgi:hypothetical protein
MRIRRLARLMAAAACVARTATLSAQREQLSFRVEQFGRSDARESGGGTGRTGFDTRQFTVTAAHRSVLGADGSTVLVNGLFYRQSEIGLVTPAGFDRRLHAIYYDLLALRTLDDKHTLAVAIRPGFFGNLEHELGEQFRVEGAVFVDRIVTPRTTLGLGMSYTSNFGRVIPVPVVHIVHRRGRKVLVDGLLPSRLDVWYFPRKGVELGLNAQLSGFQYYVGEPSRNGAPSPMPASAIQVRNPEIQLANATIGPQLRWNAAGKWYLSAEAGTTVVRRFSFGIGDREVALEPNAAVFGRVGVQRMF